ncbi:MAG: methionyl-tRNA formyltransferase, partial [Proteiniphilum sp.]|nr:methionyl-tRNA formyltransferase [Proteiniphilum sp.]
KLYGGEVVEGGNTTLVPGTIITDNKTFLHVVVKDGAIRLTDLQLSGKKRMEVTDFLRGYVFPENARLH